MYSIKLYHGQGMTFPDLTTHKTVCAEVWWEGEDGERTKAATTSSCIWTEKTAKRADDWARKRGLDLKADYGAYLRKHGERKEVVLKREEDAKRAESKRVSGIRQRCAARWDEIIRTLAAHDERLAGELEHG
jgi:hypothetical protein